MNGDSGLNIKIILITALEFVGLILLYNLAIILYYYFTANVREDQNKEK